MEMRTVFAVSVEDDSSGAVDWYYDLPSAEGDYVEALNNAALAGNEVNLFACDVQVDVPGADSEEDAITGQVDAIMWDRSYTPMRWRKGKNHSAAPHATPPTDGEW